MNTKRYHLYLGLLFLLFSSASAVPSDKLTEEQCAQLEQKIAEAKAALNLTEEQEEAFIEISERYGAQMIEIRDSSERKMKKARQLKKLMSKRDAEMKALLSEEQFATYEEIQAEMRARIKEQRSSK